MLVPFIVDPEAFLPESDHASPLSDLLDRHARLVKLWKDYGVLVIPGERESTSVIYSNITQNKAIPEPVRKLWMSALRYNRKVLGSSQLDSIFGDKTIDPKSQPRCDEFRLISLLPVRADIWGLADGSLSKEITAHIEFCRLGHEEHSNAFKVAATVSKMPIIEGDNCEQIWRDRFDSLVATCSEITIVDRYAAHNHFELKDRGLGSGLLRTLERIARHRHPKKINFFFSINADMLARWGTRQSFISALTLEMEDHLGLSLNGLRELNLYWCDDSCFGGINHCRYMRFGASAVVLDTGLEPFGDRPVERSCLVNYFSDWSGDEASSLRRDEQKLRNTCKTVRLVPPSPQCTGNSATSASLLSA